MTQLNADFFRPFVDGTIKTLKVSCSVDAKTGKPFFKGREPQPEFGIAGVIGLASSGFTGSITICFPEQVFLSLMEKMLGEKYTEITTDLQDGAAEILNMIFGHAKVILNEQGHTMQKAIPTVIRGKSLVTTHPGGAKVMVLPFETPVGAIHIEICSQPSETK